MMPKAIVGRLLDDRDISSFLGLSQISYQGIGSFHHEKVVEALDQIGNSNERVELIAKNGRHFQLTCTHEGIWIAPLDNTEGRRLVPELRFLDRERNVRLEAFAHAMEQCWPTLRSAERWQSLLEERRLSEIEFAQLVAEIRETPGQILAATEKKLRSGGDMDASEFFPARLAYYEALLGAPPESMKVAVWIEVRLLPHLRELLRQSLLDGLRCACAMNIDSRLSPVKLVSDTPVGELVDALNRLKETRSPIALMGIVEIALARINDDERFRELASNSLNRLFGERAAAIGIPDTWRVMPAIVSACLKRISATDEVWSAPLYWRRLAAFVHANLLVEMLESESIDADQFVVWLDGLEGHAETAVTLADYVREPLWTANSLGPLSIRAMVVGRVMSLNALLAASGLDSLYRGIVAPAVEALRAEGGFANTLRPGPLNDEIRLSDMDDYESTDSDSTSAFVLKAVADLESDPSGSAWNGFASLCRLLLFDQALLDSLVRLIGRITLGQGVKELERFFEALMSAAEIAATQPCEALADTVGIVLVQEAGRFAGAPEAEAGYRILMTASAAYTDDANRREWIGRRMSDYAFSLPKGDACRQLLASLDALSAMTPLTERFVGRARKFASSAIS